MSYGLSKSQVNMIMIFMWVGIISSIAGIVGLIYFLWSHLSWT